MKRALQFVNLLLVLVTPSLAYEDCNAIYVNGKDSHTPGKCTTFPECPILFDIIKSPLKTKMEVKLIQDLTCQPDNINPTVCCATDDIKSNEANDYYARQPPPRASAHKPGSNDGILFVDPEQQSAPKEEETHPNFRLLPPITKCGLSVVRDRIIGGNNTSILAYPWLARIGYLSHEDDTIKYLCAGTIINNRYILTAAHCTQEINPEEYEPLVIRLAHPDMEPDEVFGLSTPIDIDIERIIPHEKYNKRDKSNDIGLIRLKKEIPIGKSVFTQAVCLPFVKEYGLKKEEVDPSLEAVTDNGKPGAMVAGWGKTQWNDQEGSENLLEVALPVISVKQCQNNYEHHARVKITEKQLCAGGKVGEDSCGGDSGGGLFIHQKLNGPKNTKRGVTFQFGVVSFGPTHCGVGGLPGVYSNIHAYKKWILDNLEE